MMQMSKLKTLVLGLTALGFLSSAYGAINAEGWKKINDAKGVQVYSKEVKDSPIVAFKGETIIEAPIQKVFAVLLDNKYRKEWVDRLKVSKPLEKTNDFDYVIYQEFGLPWPMSNRDFVYRGSAKQDSKGTVVLTMQSVNHSKAPETVGVRAQLYKSIYKLSPIEEGRKTRVLVEIHSDPKGLIPNWLVNLIQKSWPLKTLSGIRSQVAKDQIAEAELPPVTL